MTKAAEDPPTSFDQDRFEALMRLAEFSTSRVDKRREFEWKVTLGFWGVIVLACQSDLPRNGITLVTALLVLVLYSFGWLAPLMRRNLWDTDEAFAMRNRAAALLDLQPSAGAPTPPKSKLGRIWNRSILASNWSARFQTLITALLLAAFFLTGPLSSR